MRLRDRLDRVPPPVLAGALVFAMAFALYSFSTQPLTGYEPETGAVTEGLVLEGHLWDDETSSLPLETDIPGRGEHRYARTGLLQPLLEAPFFALGHLADKTVGHFSSYANGYAFLWFYNPFVAALAAVAIFALVLQTRRSLRWATAIAFLFTVASIAWPYSKIGMETTFMAGLAVSFALAVWARRRPSTLSWALTGLATGATVATKAYAAVALLPIAVLLWPAFLALDRRQKLRLGLAVCLPVLLWIGAIGWYNWWRFGSVTTFGYEEPPLNKGVPIGFLGLLFSPGKGLIFYSPLVVIGALGLPRLWRADRYLAWSLLVAFIGLITLSALSTYWGDEVWGPRYIVPVAWTMLVPIAWWARTELRQKVVAGMALVAILVQVIGVSAQYAHYTDAVRGLTGVPIYRDRLGVPLERIPYGDDPTRWIPELSALLVQTEGLISSQVVDRLGGDGLKVTYAPFEGRSRTVNLSDPRYAMPLDFWWYPPPRYRLLARGLAALLLAISVAAAAGLYVVSFGRRRPWTVWASAAAT
jgi:hypothetical protein